MKPLLFLISMAVLFSSFASITYAVSDTQTVSVIYPVASPSTIAPGASSNFNILLNISNVLLTKGYVVQLQSSAAVSLTVAINGTTCSTFTAITGFAAALDCTAQMNSTLAANMVQVKITNNNLVTSTVVSASQSISYEENITTNWLNYYSGLIQQNTSNEANLTRYNLSSEIEDAELDIYGWINNANTTIHNAIANNATNTSLIYQWVNNANSTTQSNVYAWLANLNITLQNAMTTNSSSIYGWINNANTTIQNAIFQNFTFTNTKIDNVNVSLYTRVAQVASDVFNWIMTNGQTYQVFIESFAANNTAEHQQELNAINSVNMSVGNLTINVTRVTIGVAPRQKCLGLC